VSFPKSGEVGKSKNRRKTVESFYPFFAFSISSPSKNKRMALKKMLKKRPIYSKTHGKFAWRLLEFFCLTPEANEYRIIFRDFFGNTKTISKTLRK
jgi:hypothetical protein